MSFKTNVKWTKKTRHPRRIEITTAICQLRKGEDIVPGHVQNAEYVALMVGDGHSGSEVADLLSTQRTRILCQMLQVCAQSGPHEGVKSGMEYSQLLCNNSKSGAMLVLAIYEKASRRLVICSVGDSSCTVYQNDVVVHEQLHQDVQTIMETPSLKAEATTLGIVPEIRKRNTMIPRGGRVMDIESRPSYFRFPNSIQMFQSASFVGHLGFPRLLPCISEHTLMRGPFHVVMSSDGVSGVMSPHDGILTNALVDADIILQEAKKRWTTPFFKAQSYFEDKWTTDGYMTGHITPTIFKRTDFEQVEYNQGADDISVLVMHIRE